MARGKAASRAALITSALEREMRRQAAEADATILREQGAAASLLARAIVRAYALDSALASNS